MSMVPETGRCRPCKCVTLDFGYSAYVSNAPGVPLTRNIVSIPLSGELPSPDCYGDLRRQFGPAQIRQCVPSRSKIHEIPAVVVGSSESRDTDLEMLWIGERNEWVAIYHRQWYESDAWGGDREYFGPCRIYDHHAAKILEAFGIPQEKLLPDKAAHTAPDMLEALARTIATPPATAPKQEL